MTKSVHITNYYHRDSGGISTSYNKLLEAAARHRRHVRLIVPGETNLTEDVNDFARIYFVKARYSPIFDKRYRIMMPWSAYIFDQAPVKTILRQEAPDIIEIGEKYTLSLMAGLLRKKIMNIGVPRPMLLHFSCERMDDNVRSFISARPIGRSLSQAYIRNYILPMFDFHVANSTYTAAELIDAERSHGAVRFRDACWRLLRAPKVPLRERIFVSECGVDNETFRPERRSDAARARLLEDLDLPPNAKVLLYAGRLSPEKNVMLLPEIMKLLASDREIDYRLVIAGGGPAKEALSAEFRKSGVVKAVLIGNVGDRERLADIFANCDAFIHPNPNEPFGITPLEAMSSGLPVVAPNSGGILSYADESNAWLVDATAESVAEAVREIAGGNGRVNERRANALNTARRYIWENATDSLFALYDKLFADFSARRDLFDYSAPDVENNLSAR